MFNIKHEWLGGLGYTHVIIGHGDDGELSGNYDFYIHPELGGFHVGIMDGESYAEIGKTLDATELDQLIAELQRMRSGCFDGEWPKPEPPKRNLALERLLREEEEIERATRAHREQRAVDVCEVTGFATTKRTILGRPTVGALRAFLANYDDEHPLAINVDIRG